jgi:hypothetical protein
MTAFNSATNRSKAMRRRNEDSMGWGVRFLIGIVVLLVAGGIGLTIYGGHVAPAQHPIEQVVPNDRLPT